MHLPLSGRLAVEKAATGTHTEQRPNPHLHRPAVVLGFSGRQAEPVEGKGPLGEVVKVCGVSDQAVGWGFGQRVCMLALCSSRRSQGRHERPALQNPTIRALAHTGRPRRGGLLAAPCRCAGPPEWAPRRSRRPGGACRRGPCPACRARLRVGRSRAGGRLAGGLEGRLGHRPPQAPQMHPGKREAELRSSPWHLVQAERRTVDQRARLLQVPPLPRLARQADELQPGA